MEEAQAKFSHATALIIHLWSALDIAVRNEWAGPESSNIRDWLGGVVVDMFAFPSKQTVEADDVEEVLLQVVEDEFDLRLEDDSAYQVRSCENSWADVRLLQISSSRMVFACRGVLNISKIWKRYTTNLGTSLGRIWKLIHHLRAELMTMERETRRSLTLTLTILNKCKLTQ
jgi:Pre-rRNA-processing protein TSR2